MDDKSRLLALVRTRALRRGHFVLSSGKESTFYLDCRQVTLQAEGLALIGRLFLSVIEQLPERPVAAGGLTLGADPLAVAVALASQAALAIAGSAPRLPGEASRSAIDAFIVRKEPKGHGTGQWLEGTAALVPGAPVVVLEDVITTGASTLRALERCREAGLRVVGVVALIDRQEDEGLGRVAAAAAAPVHALFRRSELLEESAT